MSPSVPAGGCSATAAFGSGFAFSLISGLGTPLNPVGALQTGAVFAVVQGGLFTVGGFLFVSGWGF